MKYLLMLTLALSFTMSCKKAEEKPPAPKICADYAYILSRVPGTQDVAACRHDFDDFDMSMEIKASGEFYNRTTMVYCTCSEPKPTVLSE
jgi:hypothetical protein